ncbi:N,N'-diacetylchitobiose permease IIC component, partial [Enterobacter roggenkampii]
TLHRGPCQRVWAPSSTPTAASQPSCWRYLTSGLPPCCTCRSWRLRTKPPPSLMKKRAKRISPSH